MAQLVVHPTTKKQVDASVASAAHGFLLVGPAGSGKRALSIDLAERMLGVSDLNLYPYAMIMSPTEKKSIGIESIRQLNGFLNLKVPGSKPRDRVIILEAAETLSLEAQNALLKTLEEPPDGSVIILNAAQEQSLLPTIRSRLQLIKLIKPAKADLRRLHSGLSDDEFNQSYALSAGLPGLLSQLTSGSDQKLSDARSAARELLTKTMFERLVMVDSLSKNRQLAIDTLDLMKQMADVSLVGSSGSVRNKWERVLKASYEASEALHQNGQIKLILTNLMLNL